MVEHGCTIDVSIYGALITGFCQNERLEEAQGLVHHMKERGMSPSEDIYNSLLDCCCKLGVYAEAVRLVDVMVENGLLPLLESYKLLVCGLYIEGSNEKAKAVFHGVLSCGYNYDEVAWKVLIDGLLKRDLVDECSELLDIMEEKGCQPNPQTYSLLIEGLERT
ncbi:hypothetical protein PVL29_013645 [Vitis rotundifolia]|uniref:Pentatricopeptide repeat-containing protein n=1 Tax=Vitis rotundifolia TaxID=103349 RepID=A0AA38ZNK4_VITRO|nr:hypothetical protein PVL29_013645 [Vitis rotundifolia]